MDDAPDPIRLPVFPASWYLFGASRELKRRPVSRELLGRLLVAYRTAGGTAVVLDGRCAHLGADLGEGTVVGDTVQCAFHNWRYGRDGRCTHIPASPAIPSFARLHAYPAVERHGYLFFFNGPKPLFPLPFFQDSDASDHVGARPLRFDADAPWYLVNGNSFDAQHFLATHHRALLDEPRVDSPHPLARRICMTFGVVGDSMRDRMLRRLVGDRVEVSITSWGGTVLVVTGDFRRTRSQVLSFIEPRDADHSAQNVLVFARKMRPRVVGWLLDGARLGLRRWFTDGFMRGEFDELAGIRYRPQTMLESDAVMLGFLRWVAELPSGSSEWARDDADRRRELDDGIATVQPDSIPSPS